MSDVTVGGWWLLLTLTCGGIVAAGYMWAVWSVSRDRNGLQVLAAEMRGLGVTADGTAFSLRDERHVMVVTSREVAIVDLKRRSVAQRFEHTQIRGLRMGEGGERIELRLLLDGGAESRTLHTRSIVGFARLFQMIAGQGKQLEFIPEQLS